MEALHRLFLPVLLLCSALGVRGQPQSFRFERLTVEDGLPDTGVYSILQDHLGFLWLGTGHGLVRYDGYTVEVFQPDANDPHSIGGGTILKLHEDAQGDLWIGTDREGLQHFDRATERFTGYVHDSEDTSSLSQNDVQTIYRDRNGYLWLVSGELWKSSPIEWGAGNLDRFDPKTHHFTRFRHDPDLPGSLSGDDVIYGGVIEDDDGTLWVATWSAGLNRFDRETGRFTHYRHDPTDPGSLSDDRVQAIAKDQMGRLWVGTANGLNRFDDANDHFVRYRLDLNDTGNLGLHEIHGVHPGLDGTIWLSTHRGFGRLEPSTGTFSHYLPHPETPHSVNNLVLNLYEDHTGLLWVFTWSENLRYERFYSFEPETGRFVEHRDGTQDPRGATIPVVRAVFEDLAGNLWIGSRVGGVSKLDRSSQKFTHFAEPAGLGHASDVTGIAEDHQGRLWIATGALNPFPHDSGLHLLDREQGTSTHFRLGPADPQQEDRGFIQAPYEDRAGQLWLTGGAGLRAFDPAIGVTATFTPYPDAQNPSSNVVNAVIDDRSGRFWVGTYDGLLQFDPGTGTFIRRYRYDPRPFSTNQINVLHEDRDGFLWLGTANGIVKFDPSTERFTSGYGPPLPYNVRDIHEDTEGRLWLATSPLGLCRLDRTTGAFTAFTIREGLAHNAAQAVLEDDRGFLWVSTERGLSRFDPKREAFRNYHARDGLGGGSFIPNAALRSVTGELFFGGRHGLNAFRPNQLRDNPHPPRVVLTGLRIFDEPVRPSVEGPLHTPLATAGELRLGHRQNDVTIEYVGLHFSRPEEIQYAYRLEGYDAGWREVETVRSATYMNLSPGEYTFRVRAANADGVWNEEGASVRLVVVPPWWQRAWVRTLAVLGLLGLALAGYRWRVDWLEARARQLQEEVDARTQELVAEKQKTEAQARRLAELDAAKSRFFANLSHEFRTPLTLLLSPLQDLLDGDIDADHLARQAPLMRRNARRLLRLVNQLLDLSKLEAGRMELDRRPGDLAAFLRALVRSFAPLAERRRIALQFRSDPEALPLRFDRDAVEKAVSNLLSNALKFTPEGGHVWISASADSATAEIVVKDTGPGIPLDALERIFDRFQQVDASATREHEGTGIGLALARELVELHGGTLRVESEIGSGSAFVVRLPLDTPDDVSGATREPEDAIAGDCTALLEHAALVSEATGEESAPCPDDDRPAVLVVEDNPDVRALLRETLQADYRVLEAADGQAGWEAVQTHRPALVVSDVMMPRMDGFELCRQIKADAARRATPVLLLTARAAESDRIHGLEGGADDYVAKPFSKRELQVRVTNLILSRRQLRQQFSRELVVKPADVVIPSEDEVMVERMLAVLETYLGDSTFSVDHLADELGMSRRQVYRRFKALTGETPAELLRRLRLERAAHLLKAHPGTIAEVAYAVGFKSPAHFSTAFREHFGVSPSEHTAGA